MRLKYALKKASLLPKGIRYKLLIAFSLMSLIPLLICVYLASTYIFPQSSDYDLLQISVVILITLIIAFLGFLVIKNFVDPLLKVTDETKVIANGDINHIISVRREDEVGELGDAINKITVRIRENMSELKNFGERTKEINNQINQKVLVLSSILQIGNLISEGIEIDTIVDFILEKASHYDGVDVALLILTDDKKRQFYIKSSYNIPKESLPENIDLIEGPIKSFIARGRGVKLDTNSRGQLGKAAIEFETEFNMRNAAIFTIYYMDNPFGALIIGNNAEGFTFSDDDMDTLGIFARQLSIAVENNLLLKKTEKLSIKDELTSLFNKRYIEERLEDEIKRAILYQRPCGFILFDVDNFKYFRDRFGEVAAEAALKKIAKTLEKSVTEIDRIGRFGDDEFAVVLPEKNKRQAIEIAQGMKKAVAELKHNLENEVVSLTVSGAVSENPIDGASAVELIKKATAIIKEVKLKGKNAVSA